MQVIFWIYVIGCVGAVSLDTVYEWKYIDYLWDSYEQKAEYIRTGAYDNASCVPIDVDVAEDGRVFVTIIRDDGVPATLTTVSNQTSESGPLLRPYPDWSWYNSTDCDKIINVYRVAIDECNQMYVLDNGYIGDTAACPAKILIFDLGSDKLIRRLEIPVRVSHGSSGIGKLVTPVLEYYGPRCRLENIFMADANGWGLAIYNENRGFFRLEARAYHPMKQHVNVEIAGESFELEDSLMGMVVTPKTLPNEDGSDLIFRPFASRSLYTADTRVLARSTYGDTIKYRVKHDVLPSQASAMAISSRGTLLFGLTSEIAIGCWNRYRPLDRRYVGIAVQDRLRLQFTSGLKVIPSSRTRSTEDAWILTNRLQKIMAGTQNFEEVNFRILRGTVDDLIRGTVCEPPSHLFRNNVL